MSRISSVNPGLMGKSFLALQPFVMIAVIGVSAPLVLGFLGAWHPAFDSLAHLRAHFAVLMALMTLPLLAPAAFRIQAAAALVFALGAFSTTSNALSLSGPDAVQAAFEAKGDRAVYRLLQMNLRFDNPTPDKVLSLIGRTQPYVVTLNEVSDMWEAKLGLLSSAYPHRVFCPFPNGVFGVAILSRRPFTTGTAPRCFDRGALAIASVDFGGTDVDVGALHLGWPWPFEQSWQIGVLSPPISSLGETSLVAGDCNAAPWSAAVRRVAEIGGLTLMPSVGSTWLYRRLPDSLRFAGLPIDQVFSKGGVLIHSAERLEDTGSDHLPVMVEFSLRNERRNPTGEDKTATASGEVRVRARG